MIMVGLQEMILFGATAASFADYLLTQIVVTRFGIQRERNGLVRFVLRVAGIRGLWGLWLTVWSFVWLFVRPGPTGAVLFLGWFGFLVLNNLWVYRSLAKEALSPTAHSLEG